MRSVVTAVNERRWDFASDNTSGISPKAWAAMAEANEGFLPSYGDDKYTEAAADAFREVFEIDCEVFFVFNGTAANSLALASLCQSYHSVICHETAHVETDECGAPEFFSNGTKLLLAGGPNGKLSLDAVDHLIMKRRDIHYPRPHVLSLSAPTELGTLYRPEEIRELTALAHSHGLKVHMDGTRFANAIAALGVNPAQLTWQVGVDVLCFGGTKTGLGLSEAVVFFNRTLAEEFDYRCKQAGQLASKMRFMSAAWAKMLPDGSWLEGSAHANHCAALLADLIKEAPEVELLFPVEANAVFLRLPQRVHDHLKRRGWSYYIFIGGGARFMCSWATSEETVRELAADICEGAARA